MAASEHSADISSQLIHWFMHRGSVLTLGKEARPAASGSVSRVAMWAVGILVLFKQTDQPSLSGFLAHDSDHVHL